MMIYFSSLSFTYVVPLLVTTYLTGSSPVQSFSPISLIPFQTKERNVFCNNNLFMAGGVTEQGRPKKVGGGGIASIPSGNRRLFDPDEEGKLQGTGVINERIAKGSSFEPSSIETMIMSSLNLSDQDLGQLSSKVELVDAQNWLEHLDADGNLPLNFAKPQNPATATVLGRVRIIAEDAPGDIQHIVLKLPEGMHYVEGQSLSIIPPGTDSKTGRPNKPRLYSIASTRYGDLLDGNTISLCVRRAEYYDPETGQIDSSKKGVCSNFLCDALPNSQVNIAGPVGKTMLLPEDPNTDVIMIATGTGIAPFRGFLHRLFMENTVKRHMYGGTAWLVLGVPTTGGLLYKDEFDCMQKNVNIPGQLKIDYAISREMHNSFDGGKLYVQHVIAQNAEELFRRLDEGANVYFCGLKGMMPPILETLEKVASERGVDWPKKLSELKKNHQWHVEVY
eukprot:CAMPEP_0197834152 /NCGR_PEP_ID=MMETSP1437-20131217/21376_1 /TAXON_ID=49252 ORGANISM="Eucampia antarctica, Strain CCMP1452" /NCGR_SAMPLE_ID=MMETSP1437 /ASSEMBLY_ACC=CAM_ASM_001096 /LENGTH=447 /DNA_ID=CAMNT_0043438637 /DNA_START=52 /DNA_END=1395 /DNA_ORIENTATION=+